MAENKKNNVKKIVNKTSAKSVGKKIETKKSNIVNTAPKVTNTTNKTVKKEKKNSNNGATYATGKRKNSIAKVYLKSGSGKITINKQEAKNYLKRDILNTIINLPFTKTNTEGKFDIVCFVTGGGLSGQAGAIKHAISIALQLFNPQLRAILKKAGYLTRDSRVVERKKAGLKKARKGQVYQRR